MNTGIFRNAFVLVFLLSSFLDLSVGHASDLPQWLQSVKEINLEILEKYPPNEYFYLGVGRSPVPIIALFQEIHPDIASTVPLSSMGNFNSNNQEKVQKKLFQHFRKYFPSKKLLAGRKILLIDMTTSGKSFNETVNQTEVYLKSEGLINSLKPYAIVEANDQLAKELILKGWGVKDLGTNELAQLMERSAFHGYAEFGYYNPLETKFVHTNRVRYLDFSYKYIRQPLEKDQDFIKSLNKIFPKQQFDNQKYISKRFGYGQTAVRSCVARVLDKIFPID